jgi:hypothetical protein
MQNCNQTTGMTIWDHGNSIHDYFMDVYDHLLDQKLLKYQWKIPSWAYHPEFIKDLRGFDLETIKQYCLFHDCGKPFCRTLDENGKQHFPNHAQTSYEKWIEAGGDEATGQYILMDMDIHLLKGDGIQAFAARPQAFILLLTGLAEIHSNATMFGGIDSTSFKIKWKHINQRGKQIIQHRYGEQKND